MHDDGAGDEGMRGKEDAAATGSGLQLLGHCTEPSGWMGDFLPPRPTEAHLTAPNQQLFRQSIKDYHGAQLFGISGLASLIAPWERLRLPGSRTLRGTRSVKLV
ncbi:hypothetical protein BV898_12745 [Hypsibius exemplaris]|uniref:Uncharacterized protein n=1 Tax=Hypsibius exemplaris TaxID=2072580 RepID=A0A1W0WCR7_HYPEX|nr:hypothetical protein BV898_12745 [Hypsibius exemplaris]